MRSVYLTILCCLAAWAASPWADEFTSIILPAPRTEGGRPLMQVLKERKSVREFGREMLPPPVLSDLLWAGFGINRPDSGHRTAPSAMNSQEIDIFVAMANGLYLYEAKGHLLKPIAREDVRSKTGGQPFLKEAPIALIFVADFSRAEKMKPAEREFYSAIDTGYISQNIYLYCASEGLATVVHELPDRAALAKTMRLRSDQKIILAQAVGMPKPSEKND
ncbi:MAG: SagB/ThcOx family dehydrogenase [Verrucomicrobia bacterium]|nr:SagB/ThcOx family dehydrogenase [Verrucomicrobiota bacterium]